MNHSIVRLRTYSASLQSGVARHAAGLHRPANALCRPGWPAVKDLLVDEPPGTGWPGQDFRDTGWSAGADVGPRDLSPFQPGADPVMGEDEDGKRVQVGPTRTRQSQSVTRIEMALMAADRVMREELAKPRRGKRPCRAVELLFAGPPPWDSPEAWPMERVLEWARATLEFVRTALPDAKIAGASLHLDERSPHIHITIAPIVRHGTRVTLGVRAVRGALASLAPPRESHLKGRHRDELSQVASAYSKRVGVGFGLAVPRVGRAASHVDTDPIEGARLRAEDNEQRARDARLRAEDHEVRAQELAAQQQAAEQRVDSAGKVADEEWELAQRAGDEHDSLIRDVTLRTTQLAGLDERLGARTTALRDLDRDANRIFAEFRAQLGRLQTTVRRFVAAAETTLGRLVATLDRDVGERHEKLAQVNRDVGDRERRAADLDTTIGKRGEELAEVNRNVGDREQRLVKLDKTIGELHAQISQIDEEKSKTKTQLDQVRDTLESAKRAHAEEQQQRARDADLGGGGLLGLGVGASVARGKEERARLEATRDEAVAWAATLQRERDAAVAGKAMLESKTAALVTERDDLRKQLLLVQGGELAAGIADEAVVQTLPRAATGNSAGRGRGSLAPAHSLGTSRER